MYRPAEKVRSCLVLLLRIFCPPGTEELPVVKGTDVESHNSAHHRLWWGGECSTHPESLQDRSEETEAISVMTVPYISTDSALQSQEMGQANAKNYICFMGHVLLLSSRTEFCAAFFEEVQCIQALPAQSSSDFVVGSRNLLNTRSMSATASSERSMLKAPMFSCTPHQKQRQSAAAHPRSRAAIMDDGRILWELLPHLQLLQTRGPDDGRSHVPLALAPGERQLRGRQAVLLGHGRILRDRLLRQRFGVPLHVA